jgi:hypothetical protein
LSSLTLDRFEILHIARHHGQAANNRGRRNEGVAFGPRVGNAKLRDAALQPLRGPVLTFRAGCLRTSLLSCQFFGRIGVEKVPLSFFFPSLSSCFRFRV